MQIDMHYGAIYYLARLAEIPVEEAKKIAWSSQFVDDAEFGGTVQFGDGKGCICSNSAHQHVTDNMSAHGRLVWVPFHFLPSTETDAPFLERMKCKKDGNVANAAVKAALVETDSKLRPYRFGVALHAYADTFTHFGFSGIWSDTNLVKEVEPTNEKQDPWDRFKTRIGNTYTSLAGKKEGSLGHLLADVCPDLPYLEWGFSVPSKSVRFDRNNPADFKQAVDAIYRYMISYKSSTASPAIPSKHQEVLYGLIAEKEYDVDNRLSNWRKAVATYFEPLPEYEERKWIDAALGREWEKDNCIISQAPSSDFMGSDYWQFCQALSKHSELVVEELGKGGLKLL